VATTKFEIWYMRPEWFAKGITWHKPDPDNLELTHIHLTDLELEGGQCQLEHVFAHMQAEEWSPDGEARPLIEAKGLRHTSMSVGDVVVVNGEVHLVASFGFEWLNTEGV